MGTIIWNIDPNIIHWGSIQVRWYGLIFATVFLWGNWFIFWVFKREKRNPEQGDRLLLYIILGTIIGARLGHTLFYEPGYYLANPVEILKIWRGGLASHGAGLGILLAIYLYRRSSPEESYLWILDRMAVATALGAAAIRVGNFFNSEIIGKPTNSDWGVIFERVDSIPRHPAMLYESFAYLMIFILLMTLYLKSKLPQRPGGLSGLFLILVFSVRILIEFVKENQVTMENTWVLNLGQFLSIPMIILGFVLMVAGQQKKDPTPIS